MIAALLNHKGKILGLLVLGLVFAVLFDVLSCTETSGMVVDTRFKPHECKCHGVRVTLYDDRPADGNAKFLCLGIPE